jgi:hypothetical protein
MFKNPLLITLLLFTSLFFSCSCNKPRDGKTTVEGKVLDSTTRKPISGAKVYLLQKTSECLICGYAGGGKSAITDSSGKYLLELEAKEGLSYAVTAEFQRYFEGAINESVIPGKKNRSVEILLRPEAYLKLLIKNTSESHSISLNLNWGGGIYLTGTDIDTILSGIVEGNKYNSLVWWVTKDGNQTKFSDSVFTAAFDTIFYQINY